MQRFDGPDLETVLAEVQAAHGDAARILNAHRVRAGGIAGFFARERFEVEVEVGGAGDEAPANDDDEAPAASAGRAPTSILDLADDVSARESGVPASPTFSALLAARLAEVAADGPAPPAVAAVGEVAPPAAPAPAPVAPPVAAAPAPVAPPADAGAAPAPVGPAAVADLPPAPLATAGAATPVPVEAEPPVPVPPVDAAVPQSVPPAALAAPPAAAPPAAEAAPSAPVVATEAALPPVAPPAPTPLAPVAVTAAVPPAPPAAPTLPAPVAVTEAAVPPARPAAPTPPAPVPSAGPAALPAAPTLAAVPAPAAPTLAAVPASAAPAPVPVAGPAAVTQLPVPPAAVAAPAPVVAAAPALAVLPPAPAVVTAHPSAAEPVPAPPALRLVPPAPAHGSAGDLLPERASLPGEALTAALFRRGVPLALLPASFVGDARAALLAVLERLPSVPELPAGRPGVLAVVGERDEAYALAQRMAKERGVDTDHVVLASPTYKGRRIPAWCRVASVDEAVSERRAWRRRDGLTVVAVEAPVDGIVTDWAGAMLDALEPNLTWGVVHAGHKTEDVAWWVDRLGGVDALAVEGTRRTVTPGEVLSLGLPVGLLDGERATADGWADILLAKAGR